MSYNAHSNALSVTHGSANFNLDGVIGELFSDDGDAQLEALNDLLAALGSGYSSASFLGQIEKLFAGLKICLSSSQQENSTTEIVIQANQVLLEMIPDIQHSDSLEMQYARLIPQFIENLGSSKANIRKSTHKCIASYVKLSKKLEFVMLHIIQVGLDNPNTRTRQHSMLVIPALISLKPQVIEKCSIELIQLISKVLSKVSDPQEIVAKTARKLIIEIQKCYPVYFEPVVIQNLKTETEKALAWAVLSNDEDQIQEIINQQNQPDSGRQNHQQHKQQPQPAVVVKQMVSQIAPIQLELPIEHPVQDQQQNLHQFHNSPQSQPQQQKTAKKSYQEETSQQSLQIHQQNSATNNNPQLVNNSYQPLLTTQSTPIQKHSVPRLNNNGSSNNVNQSISQLQHQKELSSIGREILQNNGHMNVGAKQSMQTQDSHTKVAQESNGDESQFLQRNNGLVYGFLDPEIIDQLNENNQWKERTSAMETIDTKFTQVLLTEMKADFLPHSTNFLGYMLQHIPDINFKISLTSVKIITKLLQIGGINIKKHYIKLVTQLIDKLSDSKLVIRQAVIKCCSILINIDKAGLFANHAIKYVSHGNWHVREGSLHLMTHCIIAQQNERQVSSQTEQDTPISLNNAMINELVNTCLVEDKQKIQQMLVDVLALAVQSSPDQTKTYQIVAKCLKLPANFCLDNKSQNITNSSSTNNLSLNKQQQLYRDIQERLNKGSLPYVTNDGLVEFPQPVQSPLQQDLEESSNQVKNQANQENQIYNQQYSLAKAESGISLTQAPEAKATPFRSFLEGKRKQEEEKRNMQQSLEQQNPGFVLVENNSKNGRSNQNRTYQQNDHSNNQFNSDEHDKLSISTNLQSESKDTEKIAMWLPQFSKQTTVDDSSQHHEGSVNSYSNNKIGAYNNNVRMSRDTAISRTDKKSEDFNVSSLSAATVLDERKGNYMQHQKNVASSDKQSNNPNNYQQQQQFNSQANNRKSSSAMMQNEELDENNYPLRNHFGQNNSYQVSDNGSSSSVNNLGNGNARTKYTPEVRQAKPRNIQSSQMKQKGGPHELGIQQQSSYSQNNLQQEPLSIQKKNNPFGYGGNENQLEVGLSKNLNNRQGFNSGNDESQNSISTNVNDKLKLLKTNSKYSNDDKPLNNTNAQNRRFDYGEGAYQDDNAQYPDKNFEDIQVKNNIFKGKEIQRGGPVRATQPSQDFMQTIANDESLDNKYGNQQQTTPGPAPRTKKPPMVKQHHSAQNSQLASRAQSVDKSDIHKVPTDNIGTPNGGADMYSIVDQPFDNPEMQYKQAIDMLKNSDWAKQFEGCTIIKRLAYFHKQLLSSSNPQTTPTMKELTKVVDSLRSQLAKNAILTISAIFESLSPRDLDQHLDVVLPVLLKRAGDTNVFISEPADKTLALVCQVCSESRVFNCLQSQQNLKSSIMKAKLTTCYNVLIDKLGSKVRQFKDVEKLIQTLAQSLNEGAIEVRSIAKLGLLSLKNALGSQKELESLLMRYVSNTKQFDKIKQVLDKGDFESISNSAATKYGVSMRGASLDTKSAGQTRSVHNYSVNQTTTAGSDGFGKLTTSDFGMQQTFLSKNSGGAGASGAGGIGAHGFSTTSNTFKRVSANQNTSTQGGGGGGFAMSKPIDPQLMEEFRQLVSAMQISDWNKRLKAIEEMDIFVQANQNIIRAAQPSKFIQLIDSFCKVLNDNNSKVLTQAQTIFMTFLQNPNLKPLFEANVTMIVQALTANLGSNNTLVRDQGDAIFDLLDKFVEPSLLISPIVAQLGLSNNRAKPQLVQRLIYICEKCDKVALIQKYVIPLTQQGHKLQAEAVSNQKLKEMLQGLQYVAAQAVSYPGPEQKEHS